MIITEPMVFDMIFMITKWLVDSRGVKSQVSEREKAAGFDQGAKAQAERDCGWHLGTEILGHKARDWSYRPMLSGSTALCTRVISA